MSFFDLGNYGATIELTDKSFSKGIDNAEKKMGDFQKKSDKFSNFLKTAVVGSVAAVATAIGGTTIAGLKMADDLQKSFNDLQTSTGATDEEMIGMKENLENIYNNNFGESFQDIADAMANVKQNTGLAGEELEKATENAIMLRDTFGTEVAESTQQANQLMEQFGISSEEAFTLMAQGYQNGLDYAGDFGDSVNEYAVYFKQLGFDAEDMFDTFGAGADAGAFNLDKVGDTIKELGIRTKDMSDSSREGFEDLGLDADEMFAKFAEGGESAQEATQEVFAKLGELEDPLLRNQIGVSLMGTQFEDLEADTILALGNVDDKFNSTADTLEQINEVKYDSFGEALQGIGRNFNTGLLIPLGEKVLPHLNNFAEWINEQMPVIQGVFEDTFEAISEAVDFLTDVFDNLVDFFEDMADTNGDTFEKMSDKISDVFSSIREFFQTYIDIYQDIWDKYGGNIISITETIFDSVKVTIQTVFDVISGIFDTITGILQGDWEKMGEGLEKITSSIWSLIENLFSNALDLLVDIVKVAGGMLLDAGEHALTMLWDGFKAIWDSVVSWFDEKLSDLFSFFTSTKDTFYNIGYDMFSSIWNGLKGIWGSVSSWVSDKVSWLADKLFFWRDSKNEMNSSSSSRSRRQTSYSRLGGIQNAYSQGTPWIPDTQVALLHKGEAVIPAEFNPFNSSGNFKSSEIGTEKENTNTYNLTLNIEGFSGTKKEADNLSKTILDNLKKFGK